MENKPWAPLAQAADTIDWKSIEMQAEAGDPGAIASMFGNHHHAHGLPGNSNTARYWLEGRVEQSDLHTLLRALTGI